MDETGRALRVIGICYENGNGIEKDPQKAFESYKQSAEKGDIDGRLRFADCYYNGTGTKQDYSKAFDLYSNAAPEDESGRAFHMMAICCEFGHGVDRDPAKATEYYKKSRAMAMKAN